MCMQYTYLYGIYIYIHIYCLHYMCMHTTMFFVSELVRTPQQYSEMLGDKISLGELTSP